MNFVNPAEEFYKHVFSASAQGAFQLAPRGRYLRVNASAAKIFGYASPAEMVRLVKDAARQVFANPKRYDELITLLKTTGSVKNFESQNRRKDGSLIWTSCDVSAIRGPSGRVKYYAGFLRDITEEKLKAMALGDSETRYRVMAEQSPAAVYIDAVNNNLETSIYVSPQIESITGYTPAEWTSSGFWRGAVYPEDRQRFMEENDRTNRTGDPFDMEYRVVHKQGRIVWIRDMATLVRDADNKGSYWRGSLIDITEQKNMQEAARQSEDRFRKTFQASPIAACISTLDRGLFLDVNDAYLKLSGFSRERVVGQTAAQLGFIDDIERAKWMETFRAAGFSLSRQNSPFNTANGQILDTLAFYERIEFGGHQAILSMFHDTTLQADAEKALYQSEERFRALVEHIPAVLFIDSVIGDDRKTLYISPQIEALLGYTVEEWMADPDVWMRSIHPLDRERVLGLYAQSARSEKPFSCEYRLIARDEKVIWIQDETSLIHDQAGNPLYWQGFLLNITGKKKAQDALTEVVESYRGLFDSVTDAIYIQDTHGRFLDVNLGAANMYGYPREFFLGKTPDFLSAPGKNDMEAVKNAVERAIQGSPQQFDFWGKRKNGEVFPKDVHLYKGNYLGQDVVFAIARDITERKKAQDARERQVKELTTLHALAVEGARANNEDGLIAKATEIIGRTLYTDTLGFLIVDEGRTVFHPHPSYRGFADTSKIQPYSIGSGITGQVIKSGKPLNVRDVQKVKQYIQINPATRSELCIPMEIGGRVIGAINAESAEVGFFTEADERLLMTIAGQIATAIERLRKERAEREQRILAEALRDIASTLNSALDLDTVMDSILINIDRVVPCEAAIVYLIQNDTAIPIRYRGIDTRGQMDWIRQLRLVCDEIPDMKCAIATREPQLILDTASESEWIRFHETEWIRSHLLAPIQTENNVIGFIALEHDQPNFFSKRDAERLMAFANQAASAIENARRFQNESHRTEIIGALAEIANIIATTQDVNRTLDEITTRSLKLLNARDVAIYLLQDDNKTLEIVNAQGKYREQLIHHTLKVGGGITGRVVVSGKAEIVNNMETDSRRVTIPGTPEEDSLHETMMSAPLILREKPIGAINAWRLLENGLFNETELSFLVGIAHQASIAIESGRLFDELSRRARESAAIAEVGRDISATLKLDLVLERIAAYAKELLRAETSAAYLTEPNQVEMRAIAAMGTDAAEIKSDPLQIGQGILGNIALQKSGEIVNDTTADPRTIIVKGTKAIPFEHIMGVPILLKDQLTGLLAVWRIGDGQDFTPVELNFLASLAQQAAIAIENARLFHAEQLRRQEAETLREATAVVATTLERERAIELILEQLARVLKYDSASVQLLRDGYLEVVGGRGWISENAVMGLKFPVPGNNPNTRVIQEQKPFVLNSVTEIYEPFHQQPHAHIRSWLGAPLIAHGEVIGMLAVDSREEGYFTDEHIRLVTVYANQAAIAIDNAQLHERSEEQIRRLTALRDVDAAIASSLDLRVTLNILMDNAASQLRAEAMSILVYNPSLQVLETIVSLGFLNPLTRRQVRIGEELAGRVGLTRQPFRVQELREAPEYSHLHWRYEEGFVTYIGYPLIGKGQMKGVLEAFFRSPFSPGSDWLDFMQTLARQAAIAIDNAQLFENLQRTNQDLSLAYDTTLEGWGRALELRDKETEGHTRRVAELTIRLARRMNISESELTHIYRGVLLHDIGKMGVPDHILRKTGPLNEAEWAEMRKHPQYAFDLLHPIAYLRPALGIPFSHHEKWDGSGYPLGLKGADIPLAARIFAVVDVWDALLSNRPYRETWTREQVLEYIRNEAGTRFDPNIVPIFLEMMTESE